MGGLKFFVVMAEHCFPPTSGGRLDRWTRSLALARHRAEMVLLTWGREPTLPREAAEAYQALFRRVHYFKIGRDVRALTRRLAWLPSYSPHLSARFLSDRTLSRLVEAERGWCPDFVLLDGLYGLEPARRLADLFGAPLVYRSHNVEFRYMRSQAREATNLSQKLAWNLASINLAQHEHRAHASSLVTLDISLDDMEYWRQAGVGRSLWLPTLFDFEGQPFGAPTHDAAFVGNLASPNNLVALRWFVNEVLPKILQRRPHATVFLAGSGASADTAKWLRAIPNVTFAGAVEAAATAWDRGRVLINPIRSGSGINVKSIEMLFRDRPLVSTSVGVRGLPRPVSGEFVVADSPKSFADALVSGSERPWTSPASRDAARAEFGFNRVGHLVADLQALKREAGG